MEGNASANGARGVTRGRQVGVAVLVLLIAFSGVGLLAKPTARFAAAGPGGVTLSLLPETVAVSPGDTVHIDVVLDKENADLGISAASLQLRFDPAVLRATAFEAVSPRLIGQEYGAADGGETTSLVVGAASCDGAQLVPDRATIGRITFETVGSIGAVSRIRWRDATALAPVVCGITSTELQTQSWAGVSENVVTEARGATICVTAEPAPCSAPPLVPLLALSPGSGPRGGNVEVTVSDFQPGEEVTVTWDQGKPKEKKKKGNGKNNGNGKGKKAAKGKRFIRVGTVTAALDGDASLSFTVPRNARSGGHAVAAIGSDGSRDTERFTVTSGRPRAASGDADRDSRRSGRRDRPHEDD